MPLQPVGAYQGQVAQAAFLGHGARPFLNFWLTMQTSVSCEFLGRRSQTMLLGGRPHVILGTPTETETVSLNNTEGMDSSGTGPRGKTLVLKQNQAPPGPVKVLFAALVGCSDLPGDPGAPDPLRAARCTHLSRRRLSTAARGPG